MPFVQRLLHFSSKSFLFIFLFFFFFFLLSVFWYFPFHVVSSDINVTDWNISNHLKLADPYFNLSKESDLLLSADVFFSMLCSRKISPKHTILPFILNSKLGWLFSGPLSFKMEMRKNYSIVFQHRQNYFQRLTLDGN